MKMPRPNQARTIASEANLAARIMRERQHRGMSYQGLADAMTEAGCSINRSAIYRIETADPPRRISVDELVALGEVFDLPIEDLLIPAELVDRQRALQLVKDLKSVATQSGALMDEMLNTLVAYYEMANDDVELVQFVANHIDGFGSEPLRIQERLAEVTSPVAAHDALVPIVNGWADLWDHADSIAKVLVELEKVRSDGQ